METATASQLACAARTRERCPSCSDPMVGTSPKVLPAARKRAHALLVSAMVFNTSIALRLEPGRAFFPEQSRQRIFAQMVALLFARELTPFHIVAVVIDRIRDQGCGVTVPAYELSGSGEGQIDEIVQDEYLPIAMRPGADTDSRDVQRGGDALRHFRRNSFQDHCE